MLRIPLFIGVVLAGATGSVQAQVHQEHHHPRGAKIIMIGTVVDPLCAFAQHLPDSAQAGCSRQHPDRGFQLALMAGGELYILGYDHDAARRSAGVQALVGKEVKVDGTVYPAGNSYLIVVDSIRPSSP